VPENLTILDIRFSAGELAALDGTCGSGGIIGNRYPAFVQKFAAQ
jgi:hypothetical protein